MCEKINENRSRVVEYIIKNNKVLSDDSLINQNEDIVSNEVLNQRNSNILKPNIKNNQKKKPIKPVAPMKVGRK